MKGPLLATTTISYCGKPNHRLIVHGGLHHIKGNHSPYFGITGEIWNPRRKDDCEACGCLHEEILKRFPKFADLVALHLSDINGIPMHGEANGWYDLAGALPGNAQEQYHRGNSEQNFPLPADRIDPAKPWKDYEHRKPTPDECLQMFADHMRVSMDIAREVRDKVSSEWLRTRALIEDSDNDIRCSWSKESWKGARAWFGQWVREQHPRWKQEAEDCIAKHSLVVYGDPWPVAEVA